MNETCKMKKCQVRSFKALCLFITTAKATFYLLIHASSR